MSIEEGIATGIRPTITRLTDRIADLERALASEAQARREAEGKCERLRAAAHLEPLLASAEPTISRQGDLIMLDCPDGTITDAIFDALEAACYAAPPPVPSSSQT